MKWLRLIAAWIGGIIAAVVVFAGVATACWLLVAIYTAFTEPSAAPADTGWNYLMVSFFVWPFIGLGSAVAGLFAGNFLNRKMRSQMQPADQKKGAAN